MSKKFSIFLTALFCAFIGGMSVASLLLPISSSSLSGSGSFTREIRVSCSPK